MASSVGQDDRDYPPDDRGFVAFYDRERARLVGFLRSQGASPQDAQECVQETLTRAYLAWAGITRPYAWCRKTAYRRYLRLASTRREDLASRLDDLAAPGLRIAPSSAFEEVERRHETMRLLNKLPPRQRQVMAWTFDEATPQEIADALNMTPAAVRSSLRKARATLRPLMRAQGVRQQ